MQQRSGLSGNRDRPGPGGLGIGAKLLIRKTERGIVHEDTDCVFGEVNPAHLEKARKKDPPPPWIDDAPAAVGHPDSGDIKLLAEKIQACFPGDSML